MTRQPSNDLLELLDTLSGWSSSADVAVYLFGSRVRGDHRADSDVDLLIVPEPTDLTVDWHSMQEATHYSAIQELLPGPIALIDPHDEENQGIVAVVAAGPVVLAKGNVRCVWLAPKHQSAGISLKKKS